jgi:hypothetical protein
LWSDSNTRPDGRVFLTLWEKPFCPKEREEGQGRTVAALRVDPPERCEKLKHMIARHASAPIATFARAAALTVTGIFTTLAAHGGEMRLFHSAEGKPLKASFEGASGDTVTLKREDGKLFTLLKEKLSTEDRFYISGLIQVPSDEANKLNVAACQPLASTVPFSERKAEELAQMLNLRSESKSKYGRSWRLYAAGVKDYRIFGAMPYSVALYSNEAGFATHLSIVFANKGDFGSQAGVAEDHFKGGTTATANSLAEAMNRDEQTVAKTLTAVLGEAKSQRYGEGDTRRKISRWDWNGYAFLLSNEEGEYVSLAVIPPATADAGGRSTLTRDKIVKDRLLASIIKSPNGDVYLTEIPMVDQGPKGYCVPATFERAMRTMGLDADMYLLAMIGQSKAGGGTSVELLMENVKRQVTSRGRRIKDEALSELRIKDVKSYLNSGIPIMWRMCSASEYNAAANSNTAARSKVTDWNAHAAEVALSHLGVTKSPKPDSNHHVCMIIGYNEETQELAVSDSWGASFELRWVPVTVANWANNGGIFMILP